MSASVIGPGRRPAHRRSAYMSRQILCRPAARCRSVLAVVSTPPPVTRTILTEADYSTMNWHDNAVHAIAWEPLPDNPGRLLLDIDYILQWVAPEPPTATLSFWISPATLVFDPA